MTVSVTKASLAAAPTHLDPKAFIASQHVSKSQVPGAYATSTVPRAPVTTAPAKGRLCPLEEFRRIQSHYPQLSSTGCTRSFCQSGRMVHTDEQKAGDDRCAETVEADAVDFLHQLRRDGIIESDAALKDRVAVALQEIRQNTVVVAGSDGKEPVSIPGNWHQTTQELEHGLRLSWKHARKCIMRSEYPYLKLHDLRHITTSKEMAHALLKGMHDAFNRGDIQPSVFVFPAKKPNRPGPMLWNQQFLSFAGYRQPDGSVLGDPMTVSLTESIIALGWEPPAMRTRWDLLPVVTMADGDDPYIMPLPESLFPLVRIRHPNPQYALEFDKLGLRWVPAPALSRLGFDIGGVHYTGTPFIGWFMDAEVGVRDLADTFRYDVLPSVVSALKLLQPGQELDELPQAERLAHLSRAQLELNFAANWSFADAGVRMSDSLTASAMYTNFDDQHLAKHGFRLSADPYWLAPPQGSIIPVWHRGASPNYQPKPMICRVKGNPAKIWEICKAERAEAAPKTNGALHLPGHALKNGTVSITNGTNGTLHFPCEVAETTTSNGELVPSIRTFYCSSGTSAQRLATKLEKKLRIVMDQADPCQSISPCAPLNDLDFKTLAPGDVVLIVASCAGRGDIPTNGLSMLQKCKSMDKALASKVSFCVFGNGNSSYGANFNGAAIKLQSALENAGLDSAVPLFQADTLKEDPPWRQFDSWFNVLNARYGSVSDTASHDSDDSVDESSGLLLAQLSPVEVISVHATFAGGMKRVALDVGNLQYSDMSHVDVFMPLSENKIDELLWTARLTGKEVLKFEEGQVSTRQLFSLVEPEKPFKSVKWATKMGLGLSSEKMAKMLHSPMMATLRELPIGWQSKAKRNGLSEFMLALPTRRSRTFSTASSQMYWGTHSMANVLELTVQTHEGGLFTDRFLSKARTGDQLYVRIRHGPGHHLIDDQVPLIVFTTGSGIAPLRGLLQARCALVADRDADGKLIESEKTKIVMENPVSLFLGFRPDDSEIISESVREAMALGLVDILLLTPSNPAKERAQDKIFKDTISEKMRKKIQDEGANVFVCASKEAADDFARNLEAVVGVKSIRAALGERWVEEVYVCTQG